MSEYPSSETSKEIVYVSTIDNKQVGEISIARDMANNHESSEVIWSKIKTRVITRAFYEDAYLDFFIKYYAGLGFDNIVILKADTDKFPVYKPPEIIGSDNINMGRIPKIEIIPVVNEGNNIIKTNYKYYADKSYDWILNIDADEFLVIDLLKYPGGIKEYIYKICERATENHKVPNAESVQQIKFRWVCINKLNNNWFPKLSEDLIINKCFKNGYSQLPPVGDIQSDSFAGYFLTNKLEMYKFVKSMCNTKWANPEPKINAHFFVPVPIHGKYLNLLDGDIRGINDSDPRHYPRDGSMLADGYILHINTRTLANAITKCLVTKLRDNKKIKDPLKFRQIVNSYTPQLIKSPSGLQDIKYQFLDQLNSKNFFPQKIHRFNSLVSRFIKDEYIYKPLSNMITQFPDTQLEAGISSSLCARLSKLVISEPIINVQLEWDILNDLCIANDIKPENMRQIIELF